MSLTEQARTILYAWVQAESLRKHCESVAASMHYAAQQQGADPDLWQAVGLLHDMDYEQYPNPNLDYEQYPNPNLDQSGHPFIGVAYLREHGWSEEVCRAILSHANYANVARLSPMEKTLFAVDELSGFVTAVTLVRPDKNVAGVKVSSVKKKLKDKAFAAKVSREDIEQGAAELGVSLDALIELVIAALQAESERLGLAGTSA